MLRITRLVNAPSGRRALAEFALIVVGVLVALWVSDLNQARLDRARERTDLRQLLRTTRENELRVRAALAQDSLSLIDAYRLLAALRPSGGGGPAQPDSLTAWRRAAFRFAALSPLTGTYTAVAQTGELNLLRNDGVRAQVATYAGELAGDVQEMAAWFEAFNRNVGEMIRTLPLADLRALDRGGALAPHTLRQEPLERALVSQYVISRARVDILHRLLDGTTALRQALAAELAARGG